MTDEEMRVRLFNLSVQAGMNQRYHQLKSTYWSRWDRAVRISVASLAVIGALLSVAAVATDLPSWTWSGLVCGLLSVAAAIVLNVVDCNEWSLTHAVFLARWADCRTDVEFIDRAENMAHQVKVDLLNQVEAEIHRLCADEPSPDQPLLTKCFEAERDSRYPAPEAA